MSIIPNGLTRAVSGVKLVAKANSPKILFVGGVAAVVTGTVLACRATIKASNELDDIREKVSDIRHVKENGTDGYTEAEYGQDLSYVYFHGGVKIVKLYAPAVLIGTAGIAALTGSHVILTRRNAGLVAAYGALSKTFDEYRERVANEFGPEKESYIRRNVVEVKKGEDENGKKVDVLVRGESHSPYARLFDASNKNWKNDPTVNLMFLKCVMHHMHQRLVAKGHVFLNEVYDELGFERTKEGAVVGWVFGPHSEGDEFIDFGIFDQHSYPFTMGWESNVWLDFNVDGVILDNFKEGK